MFEIAQADPCRCPRACRRCPAAERCRYRYSTLQTMARATALARGRSRGERLARPRGARGWMHVYGAHVVVVSPAGCWLFANHEAHPKAFIGPESRNNPIQGGLGKAMADGYSGRLVGGNRKNLRLHQGRIVTPPGVGFGSDDLVSPLRAFWTKVLLSPCFDQGPWGTSLNSTNFQSVTSVSCMPRKSRTAGETSRPAPLFRFGFGRSLPKTYCQ